MKLAPFASGLAVAVALVLAHGPAAHAQSQNNQNSQPKNDVVVVKDGYTLQGIAEHYGTSYVRLFNANTNIQDPDVIHPGDQVRIPKADEQLPDRPLPSAAPVNQSPAVASSPARATTYNSAPAVAPALATSSAPVAGCGDNSYANYIYSHESGCRTTAMSPNGCYGIGQACPASKLAYCGADYACQNAFFTAYAGKYGGWAGAYSFWQSHGWW